MRRGWKHQVSPSSGVVAKRGGMYSRYYNRRNKVGWQTVNPKTGSVYDSSGKLIGFEKRYANRSGFDVLHTKPKIGVKVSGEKTITRQGKSFTIPRTVEYFGQKVVVPGID